MFYIANTSEQWCSRSCDRTRYGLKIYTGLSLERNYVQYKTKHFVKLLRYFVITAFDTLSFK